MLTSVFQNESRQSGSEDAMTLFPQDSALEGPIYLLSILGAQVAQGLKCLPPLPGGTVPAVASLCRAAGQIANGYVFGRKGANVFALLFSEATSLYFQAGLTGVLMGFSSALALSTTRRMFQPTK